MEPILMFLFLIIPGVIVGIGLHLANRYENAYDLAILSTYEKLNDKNTNNCQCKELK